MVFLWNRRILDQSGQAKAFVNAFAFGIKEGKIPVTNKPSYEELEKRIEELEKEVLICERAKEALRESQQIFNSVLDTIPVRVFWKDLDSTLLGCNRPFACDSGFQSPEEIVGRNDFEMGWQEHAQYRSDDRLVIETGRLRPKSSDL